MANRYAEDIIDIVGIDKNIKGALPDPADRQPIAASRGIGYINGKTGGVGSVSGTPGETLVTDANDGKDVEGVYTGDSNAPNPYNTFQQAFNVGENAFDIIDILDGTDGPTPSDPLASDFNSPTGAGNMNSLEGMTDCATGDEFEVHFNGGFPPIPASTWEDGTPQQNEWSDPETPPSKPGFTSGKWYQPQGTSIEMITAYDMDGVSAAIIAKNYGPLISGNGGPGSCYGPNSFSNYYKFVSYDANGSDFDVTMEPTDASCNSIGPTFSFPVQQKDCSGSPPTDPNTCPASAPVETQWPYDDKINFKFEDGQFKTSTYDPEVPVEFSTPNSKLNFCATGGRYGSLELLGGGDFAIYETSTEGGSPSGVVRVYRSDGSMKAATDAAGLDTFKTTN